MTCNKTSTLTDEQKGRICGALAVGCDRETAANIVGCSLGDIRRAMQVDAEFALRIRRAEATTELNHMQNVKEAAKDVKNWRASVWWLERHSPERFGKRGAGQITSRQLRAFTAIIADILVDPTASVDERKRLQGKLKQLSDAVDQLLRDEQCADVSAISFAGPRSSEPSEFDESLGDDDRSSVVDFEPDEQSP
jgi:hypothetical protein